MHAGKIAKLHQKLENVWLSETVNLTNYSTTPLNAPLMSRSPALGSPVQSVAGRGARGLIGAATPEFRGTLPPPPLLRV